MYTNTSQATKEIQPKMLAITQELPSSIPFASCYTYDKPTFPEKNFFDIDGAAVPYDLIEEIWPHLQYGSKTSRGIKLLYETGCRGCELKKMHYKFNFDGVQHWRLGKNQTGKSRAEKLSDNLIKEIEYGMRQDRHRDDLICDIDADTLNRYFNKFVRPLLSAAWQVKVPKTMFNEKEGTFRIKWEFKHQLKGLRKNFLTDLFAYYHMKYKNVEQAVRMTAKRAKHEVDSEVTWDHYIDDADKIGAYEHCKKRLFGYVKYETQSGLQDHIHLPNHFMRYNCKGRPPKVSGEIVFEIP